MAEIFRVSNRKATFTKNGIQYKLYLATTELKIMPKSVTSSGSIVGTDGTIMATGTETKNASITLPVLNAIENFQTGEILSSSPSFDSFAIECEQTNGLPVKITGTNVIRKTDFQFDIGVGGSESNSMDFDCGSLTIVR